MDDVLLPELPGQRDVVVRARRGPEDEVTYFALGQVLDGLARVDVLELIEGDASALEHALFGLGRMLEVNILAIVFRHLFLAETSQPLDILVVILQPTVLTLQCHFELVDLLRPDGLDTGSD